MIDEILKLQIRAVYESNNLSVAKVMKERFHNAEVSTKTVESWIANENWKKNRYQDFGKAMEALMNEDIEKQLSQKGLALLESEVVDELPENYKAEITKEAIRKAITLHSLVMMMGENLLRTEEIVQSSRSVSHKATLQAMLISTYQAIHGKEVRHTFKDFDKKELTEEDLKNMSKEELHEIILELENDAK